MGNFVKKGKYLIKWNVDVEVHRKWNIIISYNFRKLDEYNKIDE